MVQIHYRPPPDSEREGIVEEKRGRLPDEASVVSGAPTDLDLREMVGGALPADSGLTPLRGLKMDLSANRGFRKVFFSAHCECGTAAVLSVEVAEDKTARQIEDALPVLVDRLVGQAETFRGMSCEVHTRMGLRPGRRVSRTE